MGVLVGCSLLALGELGLRLWVATGGQDLRSQDPLSRELDQPVLCGDDQDLTLCPAFDGQINQVRQQHFARANSAPRVIVVGESFVYGLGYGIEDSWPGRLQQDLGEGVEVLNFGKCGAESSSLMPVVAAAIDLQPNLLILAIGNNEYAMAPYYGGLPGRSPVLFHDLLSALGQLQLYGLLDHTVGGALPSRAGRALTDLGGSPQQAAFEALHRRPVDLSIFPDGLADAETSSVLNDSKRLAERLFTERMSAMLEAAHGHGVPVMLVTVPRNPLSPPLLSGLHKLQAAQAVDLLGQLHRLGPDPGAPMPRQPARNPQPTERYHDFLKLAQEAVEAEPDLARFLWELGRALWLSDRQADALAAWERARQADLAPDSTPAINNRLRKLAAEHATDPTTDPTTALLDLDRVKDSWVGQTGSAFYKDQVHVSPEGAQAIAELVAAQPQVQGLQR